MIYIAGPGHGAPAMLSNCYLEGTYSEIYPDKSQDEAGMLKLFRAFSFPGGIGSHCTPETPGSIHEGGELGYSLSHAFGAAFDNPDLIVSVRRRRRRSGNRPARHVVALATNFSIPMRDGAVLPILHLNGYKIANPTILARIPPRRNRSSVARLRLDAALRRRRRPADDASADGGHARSSASQQIRAIQHERAHGKHGIARLSALADDRAAHAQRLDRPERSRRPQGRRLLARPSGAGARCRRQSRSI